MVREVGSSDGFPSIAAVALERDHRGRLWLSSERGLYRWDPASGRIRRYGLADGLASQEFVRNGLAIQADGTLAAVTADGQVVLIDTVADDPIVSAPRLVVDRFDVRRGVNWIPLPRRALASSDRELRVRWRLLTFHDAANDRYFTRLDGHDAQWVAHSLDEGGQRVFTNLAPGSYTLRVRAQDAQGRAAPEQAIKFEVLPAWWQTRWAWLLYAVLAMCVVAGAVWLYRRRLLRQAAWQQAQREHQFAQEASLAKTRFLATLGHEVRTPITGVLGMSELLLDTDLDQTQRSYTQAIHGAGKHLVRLVNDALDLSRIESGKLDLLAEPFDLHRLVDDVAQLAGPLARKKSLAFDCSLTPAVPQGVCGDASRVRQILLNLLGNAIKFTQAGRVWLHVDATSAGEVWLEVGDTGPGLNAEQQSRLFRRFEQAEGARTAASYGGSGLGLAICQELASLMGGSVAVESEPGSGARFRVCLPLPSAQLSLQDAVIAAHSPARRVLLVEDDDTVAQVIAGLLRAQGHTVSVVPHSLAALSELAVEQFEVALVDLDLPCMDGLTLVRHMRSQGITFPIVAVTARADPGAVDSAHAAGCDRFLRKPLSGQMLAELMADCIALAETEQKVVEHSAV